MQGNIVSAAKWLGFCIIVSSIIIAGGIDSAMESSSKNIYNGLHEVGGGVSRAPFPSRLRLDLRPEGQFNVGLGNSQNDREFDIKDK